MMYSNANTPDLKNQRRCSSRSLRAHTVLHRETPAAEVSQPFPATAPTVSALLFSAQEEERARIARELHDGIGQELALLLALMQWPPELSGLDPRMDEYLLKMRVETKKICDMARAVSHDLHPPELDFLGLKVAVESLCRRFSSGWKIPVQCTCSELRFSLNKSVSLALYRVLQEALQNIAKHSGAKNAGVRLITTQTEILLHVTDDGRGFDVEQVSCGVGLLSMRQRIASINGTMTIYSRAGFGTELQFWVPSSRN